MINHPRGRTINFIIKPIGVASVLQHNPKILNRRTKPMNLYRPSKFRTMINEIFDTFWRPLVQCDAKRQVIHSPIIHIGAKTQQIVQDLDMRIQGGGGDHRLAIIITLVCAISQFNEITSKRERILPHGK